MRGIIYYNENRKQAIEILEAMIKRYETMEIPVKRCSISELGSMTSFAEFSNGDTWSVRRAGDNARGHRCNVAYVDRSIPYEIYRSIVLPAMIEYPFCAERLWGEGDLHLDYTPDLPF